MFSARHPSQAGHLWEGVILGTREGHSSQNGLRELSLGTGSFFGSLMRNGSWAALLGLPGGGSGAVSGQRPSSHPRFAIRAPPWFPGSPRGLAILWRWAGQAGPFLYCREGKATHMNPPP